MTISRMTVKQYANSARDLQLNKKSYITGELATCYDAMRAISRHANFVFHLSRHLHYIAGTRYTGEWDIRTP